MLSIINILEKKKLCTLLHSFLIPLGICLGFLHPTMDHICFLNELGSYECQYSYVTNHFFQLEHSSMCTLELSLNCVNCVVLVKECYNQDSAIFCKKYLFILNPWCQLRQCSQYCLKDSSFWETCVAISHGLVTS